MRIHQISVVIAAFLLISSCSQCEAKRKKHHKSSDDSSESSKTKTKTKWSSSTNLGPQTKNTMVATEEHGYYVKRTFLPLSTDNGPNATALLAPPFLAVPIAWFPCQDKDCLKLNSMALNSNKNALNEGFLCEDDCVGPYEPICGKTSTEVAVFYNKCKLNVAKCRSHGYWNDLPYSECKTQYPEEVKYAESKFKRSPYFRLPESVVAPVKEENKTEVPQNEKDNVEVTTDKEQLLIQEIKDAKPVEKLEESKDSYKEIKTASGIVTEMKL
ncbi:ecdysone-inducible gene L1 [Cochliomyia hominivorax]